MKNEEEIEKINLECARAETNSQEVWNKVKEVIRKWKAITEDAKEDYPTAQEVVYEIEKELKL
jgi:hypothetical protein